MAQVDHARRLRWFDTGVDALRHIFDDPSISFYVCPLCLVPYDHKSIDDKTLTDEDVPTRATGGRPLVLTCHACNSGHGHSLDVHQARLVKFLRFGQRMPGVSLRADLVGPVGYINSGEAVWSEDGQTLQHAGIERINDWRDRDSRLEQFNAVMSTG